ncbi:hypothetical protein AHAS_Ahas06G0226700 [Arachis hypogaea]
MSDLACLVPFGNVQIVVWAQGFALTMGNAVCKKVKHPVADTRTCRDIGSYYFEGDYLFRWNPIHFCLLRLEYLLVGSTIVGFGSGTGTREFIKKSSDHSAVGFYLHLAAASFPVPTYSNIWNSCR